MRRNRSPHFLCIGAPKTGTTSWYKHLSGRPDVWRREGVFPAELSAALSRLETPTGNALHESSSNVSTP
jgi:hypothetical protein